MRTTSEFVATMTKKLGFSIEHRGAHPDWPGMDLLVIEGFAAGRRFDYSAI